MKRLIFVPILILTHIAYSFSQGKVLADVTYIPQKTETFCWAASAEMIAKFHGVVQTDFQCKMGESRWHLYVTSGLYNCIGDNLNGIASFNSKNVTHKYDYNKVFTNCTGLISCEDSVSLTPFFIKQQIDSCHPFLFAIGYGGRKNSGHVYAVNGYVTDTDNAFWISVVNPSKTKGGTQLLSLNSLLNRASHESYDYLLCDIQPKSATSTCCCNSKIKITKLPLKTLVPDSVQKVLANENAIETISYDLFKNAKKNKNNDVTVSSILDKNFQLKFIRYHEKLYEAQAYQTNDLKLLKYVWKVTRISDDYLKNSIQATKVDSGDVLSSNNYSLVYFDEFDLAFYKIVDQEKQPYYVPLIDYLSLELFSKKAYSDTTLFMFLKNLTINN